MDTKPKTPVKKMLITFLAIILVIILGLAAYIDWGPERGGSQLIQETAEKGKSPEILGPAVTVIPAVQTPDADPMSPAVAACKESRDKLQGLFAYLDRQDYIASQHLKGGASEHFKGLLARLLKTQPFVQRETDDLLWVLQNKAHFYRVLGKKDTLLLRDILRKEGNNLESFLAILYRAMVLQEKCIADGPTLQASMKKDFYPYAVFFLNTLGGSSYLMRRDSRVRMLTRYYCILILDQANQRRINKLGLDIHPPLDVLMQDLKGAANLTRKEEYIETLKTIRAKY